MRGRWQDEIARAGVLFDTVITDPPYSKATCIGHNSGSQFVYDGTYRRSINYGWWEPEDVFECVETLSPLCRGWFVAFCDDELITTWKAAFRAAGRCTFAAIPFVDVGSRVRRAGDGPSNWSVYIMVARPRTHEFLRWGTKDGAYIAPKGTRERYAIPGERRKVVGHKSQWLMRRLVEDYSRPGDLVVDPCAGGASTLIAAAALGRRGFGTEQDPTNAEVADERIRRYLCERAA